MTLGRVEIGLSGPNLTALAESLWERRLWGDVDKPQRVRVGGKTVEPSADWIRRHSGKARTLSAFFDEEAMYYLIIHSDTVVQVAFDFDGDPTDLVKMLSELSFEVASFATRHDEWDEEEAHYRAPGFSRNHFSHGWACAFRGAGHDTLVSRRWLDHGPWRLIHGPNDTTLVQFHDLELDAVAAREQAAPAHQRMGISAEGGYLQNPYVYRENVRGFYDAERRVLKIVVLGRTVPPREFRDACAARRDNILGPDQPIDNVAFVFLHPDEARAHLPRIWPYGLECWTIIDEVETRLDTDDPPEGVGGLP